MFCHRSRLSASHSGGQFADIDLQIRHLRRVELAYVDLFQGNRGTLDSGPVRIAAVHRDGSLAASNFGCRRRLGTPTAVTFAAAVAGAVVAFGAGVAVFSSPPPPPQATASRVRLAAIPGINSLFMVLSSS
jgi:hypothetical protein